MNIGNTQSEIYKNVVRIIVDDSLLIPSVETMSNNYILDINGNETSIEVSDFNNGIYTIVLVCDGIATDAKTLIIQ